MVLDLDIVATTDNRIERHSGIDEGNRLGRMRVWIGMGWEANLETADDSEGGACDRHADIDSLGRMPVVQETQVRVRRDRNAWKGGSLDGGRRTVFSPSCRNDMLLGTNTGTNELHARRTAIASVKGTGTTIARRVPVDDMVVRQRSAQDP